jgi:hypothetical protein
VTLQAQIRRHVVLAAVPLAAAKDNTTFTAVPAMLSMIARATRLCRQARRHVGLAVVPMTATKHNTTHSSACNVEHDNTCSPVVQKRHPPCVKSCVG